MMTDVNFGGKSTHSKGDSYERQNKRFWYQFPDEVSRFRSISFPSWDFSHLPLYELVFQIS